MDAANTGSSIFMPTKAELSAVLGAVWEPFPDVDPLMEPTGSDVLVQIRTPREKTEGGIILAAESKDIERWNTQIALVRALGPLAYHKRDTMEPWIEGAWCRVGMFVHVPKFGGERWEVEFGDKHPRGRALFAMFRDHEIRGRLKPGVSPEAVKAYVV